jgi:hypothetical protein
MWGPEEYREAARAATSSETRRALAAEADRIERRDEQRPAVEVRIVVHRND